MLLYRPYVNLFLIHTLLTRFCFFSILSGLVMVLNDRHVLLGYIALIMACYSLSYRGFKFFVAPFFDGVSPHKIVAVGCLFAGIGACLVSIAQQPVALLISLVLLAFGISVNQLGLQVVQLNLVEHEKRKTFLYAAASSIGNLCSALAPLSGVFLISKGHSGLLFYLIGAGYFLSALLAYCTFERVVSTPKAGGRFLASYYAFFKDSSFRLFLIANFFIWFIYGQCFSLFSWHVSVVLGQEKSFSHMLLLSGLIGVFGQIPLFYRLENLNGVRVEKNYIYSSLLFLMCFFVMVWGYSNLVLIFIAFSILSLGNIIFFPSTDLIGVRICGQKHKMLWVSLLAISSAFGEAAGSGLGLWLYSLLQPFNPSFIWLFLGMVALVALLLNVKLSKQISGGRVYE